MMDTIALDHERQAQRAPRGKSSGYLPSYGQNYPPQSNYPPREQPPAYPPPAYKDEQDNQGPYQNV